MGHINFSLSSCVRFAQYLTENAKKMRVRDVESRRLQSIDLKRGYIIATPKELAKICRENRCNKNAKILETSTSARKFIWALHYDTLRKRVAFSPIR